MSYFSIYKQNSTIYLPVFFPHPAQMSLPRSHALAHRTSRPELRPPLQQPPQLFPPPALRRLVLRRSRHVPAQVRVHAAHEVRLLRVLAGASRRRLRSGLAVPREQLHDTPRVLRPRELRGREDVTEEVADGALAGGRWRRRSRGGPFAAHGVREDVAAMPAERVR